MGIYYVACCFGLSLGIAALGASSALAQQQSAMNCSGDLEAVGETLKRNYAGYAYATKTLGKRLDVAMSAARRAAVGLERADCDGAIRSFLEIFEDGHLLLTSSFSPPVDMPPPLFQGMRDPLARALSDSAFLIRVPSFAIGFKSDLDALLEAHRGAIKKREILIVDVRGNTGGGDSTWTDLIAPIYTDPMTRWGILWRSTEDNARAIEAQIEPLRKSAQVSSAVCDAMQLVADGMRENLDQNLAKLGPQLAPLVTLPEVWSTPRRVAIIVDGSCGSSCENFLLAARQSAKVTVFGENTYGAIDFQNVRIASLPSGNRQLRFAMSMSLRVLAIEERQRGLSPDHQLPPEVLRDPDAAIEHVLRELKVKSDGAP